MRELLSIREFARLSGVESSTLRYWDKIGLFSPVERDKNSKYRYYRLEQIIAINFIKVLSSLDVPLKTVLEVKDGRTSSDIVELIENQEKLLDMKMRELRECYSVMHVRRELINYGEKVLKGFRLVDGVMMKDATSEEGVRVNEQEVVTMYMEEANMIMGPQTRFKRGGGFYEPFFEFCKCAEDLRINLSFPIGAINEDFDAFLEAPGEPNYFCSMDPTGNKKRPAGDYVVGFAHGYYGEFGNLAKRMKLYVEKNRLKVTGPVYAVYLHDEVCTEDPGQYLSQVCVAIEK